MPEIIILGGPNGAGKTSFANEYLPAAQEGLEYVNADEIARQLKAGGRSQGDLDVAAGRLMLQAIDRHIEQCSELLIETTLATLTYARRIPMWREQGYWVSLIYLRLPTVEASLARVRKRVAAGGHAIPEPVVRRRFARSLEYLDTIYKPLVDDWSVWDSLEGDFKVRETSDD